MKFLHLPEFSIQLFDEEQEEEPRNAYHARSDNEKRLYPVPERTGSCAILDKS